MTLPTPWELYFAWKPTAAGWLKWVGRRKIKVLVVGHFASYYGWEWQYSSINRGKIL